MAHPLSDAMTEVVLLNSGGIDSRVAAAMLKAAGMTVHSLTLDWNFDARDRSLTAAKLTADLYCETHFVFTYPVDWRRWNEKLGKRSMPYTASTLHALAAQYSAQIDTPWIASGIRAEITDDPSHWRDRVMGGINTTGPSAKVVILAPLFDMKPVDVTAKALELGVDLTTTWSCTEPVACETCSSCKRRRSQNL